MGLVKTILYKISEIMSLEQVKKQSIFPYYHLVHNDQKEHIKHLYSYKNIEHFQVDLALLHTHYTTLPPEQLLTKKSSNNTYLLTFDDGLSEIYTTIYPLLKEKKISAIFFINPNYVDNHKMMHRHRLSVLYSHIEKNNIDATTANKIAKLCHFTYTNTLDFKQKFLALKAQQKQVIETIFDLLQLDEKQYLKNHMPYITRAQIQEMMDNGFYFGGHSMSHRPLNELSFEEQKSEILDSIAWLKTHFGITYSLFAFPFSDRGISKRLITALFEIDPNLILFGNSGIKQDIDPRIIQRFSLENPRLDTRKVIIMENLYKWYNQKIGKYRIKRN